MRLTKSSIEGVHLIAFDMHVRPRPPGGQGEEGAAGQGEAEQLGWSEAPLEVRVAVAAAVVAAVVAAAA